MRAQLEDVEPIAPESIEARILIDSRQLRINGHHVNSVFQSGRGGGSCRKGDFDVIVALVRLVKALGVIAERNLLGTARRDSQCTLIWQMDQRRKANASVIIHEAKQRRVIEMGIEIQCERSRGIQG